MKLAISLGTVSDGTLQGCIQFCKDLEIDRLEIPFQQVPGFEEKGYVDQDTLKQMKAEIEDAGLSFSVMASTISSSMVMGGPDGKEQFDDLCKSMEAMDEAGADTLMIFPKLESPEDAQWDTVVDFYTKLIDHAENCGVKIAHHLGEQDWRSGALQGIMRDVPSPNHGLCFCLGNIWWHEGERMYEVLRSVRDKVHYVHLRSTKQGQGETPFWFDNSDGPDFRKTIKILKDIGYRGDMLAEHLPTEHYEQPRADAGIAWAVGYIKALLQE